MHLSIKIKKNDVIWHWNEYSFSTNNTHLSIKERKFIVRVSVCKVCLVSKLSKKFDGLILRVPATMSFPRENALKKNFELFK